MSDFGTWGGPVPEKEHVFHEGNDSEEYRQSKTTRMRGFLDGYA